MEDFLMGVAFLFVVEGMIYSVSPSVAKWLAAQVLEAPANQLRISGLAAMALGVMGVWVLRG